MVNAKPNYLLCFHLLRSSRIIFLCSMASGSWRPSKSLPPSFWKQCWKSYPFSSPRMKAMPSEEASFRLMWCFILLPVSPNLHSIPTRCSAIQHCPWKKQHRRLHRPSANMAMHTDEERDGGEGLFPRPFVLG
jgi:hypothetical protein